MDSSERIQEELAYAQLEDSINEERETIDDIANKYIELEQEKSKVELKIDEFKMRYKEIFDTLEGMVGEIEELNNQQNSCKEKLLNKMTEKFEVLGYSFVKVVTEVKRTFNSKQFFKDYLPTSRLYKKYVKESNVQPYVKVTKLKDSKQRR